MNHDLAAQILAEVQTLRAYVQATNDKLDGHITREDKALQAMQSGVPGGDWEAHARYHESLIKRNEWRARLYESLTEHVLKWGSVAVITTFFAVLWFALRHWLGNG